MGAGLTARADDQLTTPTLDSVLPPVPTTREGAGCLGSSTPPAKGLADATAGSAGSGTGSDFGLCAASFCSLNSTRSISPAGTATSRRSLLYPSISTRIRRAPGLTGKRSLDVPTERSSTKTVAPEGTVRTYNSVVGVPDVSTWETAVQLRANSSSEVLILFISDLGSKRIPTKPQ